VSLSAQVDVDKKPLPDFNDRGDLPEAVHQATIAEVRQRLGTNTNRSQRVFQQLFRIYRLAKATSRLERFIIFGSFVTSKADLTTLTLSW